MFSDNAQFTQFREMMKACGIELRCLWSAKTGGTRYDNIAMFQLIGDLPPAKPRTIVVQVFTIHKKSEGFSLWTEDCEPRLAECVLAITGKNPNTCSQAA